MALGKTKISNYRNSNGSLEKSNDYGKERVIDDFSSFQQSPLIKLESRFESETSRNEQRLSDTKNK